MINCFKYRIRRESEQNDWRKYDNTTKKDNTESRGIIKNIYFCK